MYFSPQEWLLVGAVATVGVLHTIVPDHWLPITLIARQRGWTMSQTVRASAIAGTGHVLSTLAIAAVVWLAGVATARAAGHWVDTIASIALIAFGGWIAVSAWRGIHAGEGLGNNHAHDHGQNHAHDHAHRHGHGHEHAHGVTDHDHDRRSRTALLLILGSSPMVEGIPAFFAAGRYGPTLIGVMSAVFAVSTIATYVILCTGSHAGLTRIRLGPLERYGEVLSGAFVALVGLIFWIWPVL